MATIPDKEPYIQALNEDWYRPHVSNISMLRLDEVHPVVSGNKWYKLKENIAHVRGTGQAGILTFGGAYSNHLIATAAACKYYNIPAVGIVRGTYAQEVLTPTLQACVHYGMRLVFVTREEYARKTASDYINDLRTAYPDYFIVPEGGANEWGRRGAEAIAQYIPPEFTHVAVSVGTGTTFAGLRNALPEVQTVYGYVPMKNGTYLSEELRPLVPDKHWQLFDDWHFGGFGKHNPELLGFMNDFHALHHVPLDMVYTAKMMYGIREQLQAGIFPKEARILCVHTGGLQGNESVKALLEY